MQLYQIKSIHVAEKLKLKDLREKFSQPPVEFSNYELVVRYDANSYLFVYNYGSVIFFNVPDEIQERELGSIQEYRALSDIPRATDVFLLEVAEGGSSPSSQQTSNLGPHALTGYAKVYFDRVVASTFTFEIVKIVCMLLAESTALEYYEVLIENLLVKINAFSKKLEKHGKMLESTRELIKLIGLCLNTKQEIISNLYIVDSPDETWESVELDRLHKDLKAMMEVDIRYRALDYKIKIIQESVEILVDLSKSKRQTFLEVTIILLFFFEIILSVAKWR